VPRLKGAALTKALETCQKGDILCVYSLSRLGRSVTNLLELSETLSKRGVDLASVTESIDTSTPAGRMVFYSYVSYGSVRA
jgi:DNA invertase Pin-like site-specific DNA recombinase